MSLIQLLFPERCRGCGRAGRAICRSCIARIPRARTPPPGTFAVYDYGHHLVRWTIRDLKYNRKSESARALAAAATLYIDEYLRPHTNIILVPIPGHPRKKRDRGFNQSELLAKWWSKVLPTAHTQHLLRKAVFTLPQAHLNRHERLRNVVGTMECARTLDPSMTYVIIDDVTTTGATCMEARRALIASGATRVLSIALAHGYASK